MPGSQPDSTAVSALDGASYRSGGFDGAISDEEVDALWLAWIADPGVPGVDYDPTEIMVGYKRDAKLPARFTSVLPPQGMRAADGANALLRHDRGYEQFTDAIAATCALRIKHQAYNDFLLFASFEIPPGRDHLDALAQVRAKFGSIIEFAACPPYVFNCFTPNDPDFAKATRPGYIAPPVQWGHRLIGLTSAWDETRGDADVKVAIIDSAFRLDHNQLDGILLNPQDEYPTLHLDVADNDNDVTPDGATSEAIQVLKHGTAVTGVAAARGNDSTTIIGVADSVRYIPIKHAASSDGNQNAGDSIIAIELAIDLGAKVISASWGGDTAITQVRQAVDHAYNDGILFCAAAGNDSVQDVHYPSAYEHAFGVGATGYLPEDPDGMQDWEPDTRASFSNWGSYVEIAAPGIHLKSTDDDSSTAYDDWTNGTSIACPIVAGAAALLISRNPLLSVDELKQIMIDTGAPTQDFPLGTVTRIDVGAAMWAALPGFAVDGKVTNALSVGLSGISVQLSGFGMVATDGEGGFRFSDVPEGSYTVSVSEPGYEFSPESQNIQVLGGHVLNLLFVGYTAGEPRVGGLTTESGSVYGTVAQSGTNLLAGVYGAANVDRIEYVLDLVPLGVSDPYDIVVEASGDSPTFFETLDLSSVTADNQQAALRAVPYDDGGTPGFSPSIPVYIFNQPGDTNADGVVNSNDLTGFDAQIGLASGDPGFIPFYDSDQDGVVTEADAAAVGYFYGAGT